MTEYTQKQQSRKSWLSISGWSIMAALFGFLFWKLFGYGRHLLRQPRLLPLAAPHDLDDHGPIEAKARYIAASNLRAGIERRLLPDGQEKLVLCAGLRNFREPWARDLGFASYGLISLGEYQATQEALEVFLLNQKLSGQFPVKVHSTSVLDRYVHSIFKREQPIRKPIRPKFVTAHNTISLDGNSLIVIAILNYTKQTQNLEFAKTHWAALKRAIIWLEEHALEEDGLLHQAAFTDWADSIARTGRILYTNVLYWKALSDLAQAAHTLNFSADHDYFASRAERVKLSINDHFWRPNLGYFVNSQQFDNLSSSGNLLAIAWGLATIEQANAILDQMNAFEMANPVPTQVVHRAYPRHIIAIENRLGGIPHYHTSAAWLWLGGWHVIALARMGRLTEAEELLFRLSTVIVRDGAVHEVYDPNGHYLSTFWYTSEAPLTWSAGMVVYAFHIYYQQLELQQPAGAIP